jgi:glycogen(starch) synthase
VLRILTVGSMYPPQHLGGYELLWQAAVTALREAGHEVRVLCSDVRFPGVPDGEDAERTLRWYWRDHEFPAFGSREAARLERDDLRILATALAWSPDVVSWWSMGGMPMGLLEHVRRAGVPAVGFVIDDWLVYGPDVDQALEIRPLTRRLGGLPARVDLRTVARWVFCSESVRQAAEQVRGPLADTAVGHLGVDPRFRPAPAPERWQGRLLIAGRLDPRKGLACAAAAMRRLDGMQLRIVGDGDLSVADALRDAERVTLEPGVPRDALAGVYAEADAVLFPVEWAEPFGLVPLEAMAVGRPVIATGRGGSGEYLVDEENCLIFDAGDADALATAIRRLAGDPDLRERLRQGGFATAARLTEAKWLQHVVAEHETLGG